MEGRNLLLNYGNLNRLGIFGSCGAVNGVGSRNSAIVAAAVGHRTGKCEARRCCANYFYTVLIPLIVDYGKQAAGRRNISRSVKGEGAARLILSTDGGCRGLINSCASEALVKGGNMLLNLNRYVKGEQVVNNVAVAIFVGNGDTEHVFTAISLRTHRKRNAKRVGNGNYLGQAITLNLEPLKLVRGVNKACTKSAYRSVKAMSLSVVCKVVAAVLKPIEIAVVKLVGRLCNLKHRISLGICGGHLAVSNKVACGIGPTDNASAVKRGLADVLGKRCACGKKSYVSLIAYVICNFVNAAVINDNLSGLVLNVGYYVKQERIKLINLAAVKSVNNRVDNRHNSVLVDKAGVKSTVCNVEVEKAVFVGNVLNVGKNLLKVALNVSAVLLVVSEKLSLSIAELLLGHTEDVLLDFLICGDYLILCGIGNVGHIRSNELFSYLDIVLYSLEDGLCLCKGEAVKDRKKVVIGISVGIVELRGKNPKGLLLNYVVILAKVKVGGDNLSEYLCKKIGCVNLNLNVLFNVTGYCDIFDSDINVFVDVIENSVLPIYELVNVLCSAVNNDSNIYRAVAEVSADGNGNLMAYRAVLCGALLMCVKSVSEKLALLCHISKLSKCGEALKSFFDVCGIDRAAVKYFVAVYADSVKNIKKLLKILDRKLRGRGFGLGVLNFFNGIKVSVNKCINRGINAGINRLV